MDQIIKEQLREIAFLNIILAVLEKRKGEDDVHLYRFPNKESIKRSCCKW